MTILNDLTKQRIPFVAFKVTDPALITSSDLANILSERLRKPFGAVSAKRNWTIVHWRIDLIVKDEPFTLLLKRYRSDLWCWMVAPRELPAHMDSDNSTLQVVCREVHKAIGHAPNISDVRWYFKDLATQSDAVASPDELPWRH
jgi:hypothetical protein